MKCNVMGHTWVTEDDIPQGHLHREEEILRNIKFVLLLIFGQHSGDSSSRDVGHP